MNKNVAIFLLVVLIFIGGIWGSLADRKRIVLEKKLKETVDQMEKLNQQTTMQREQVLGMTAGLQETLTEKEEQLNKARKELVTLRKESKALESQLSACNASIQKLSQEKEALESEMRSVKEKGAGGTKTTTGKMAEGAVPLQENTESVQGKQGREEDKISEKDVLSLQEQLQTAEVTIERLRQKLDSEKAQMRGLEKLLEEKNSAMEETSQDMDRLKINMDVLLSKITDQLDALQEVQEENRSLVKELAAKNEEIADLQEEIMRQPVQE